MSNLDVVKGMYAGLAKGDVPAFLGALDPKIDWSEAEGAPLASGNPYIGPQAVVEGVIGQLVEQFDGFTVTPQNFIDGGDSVVAEGRYTGTFKQTGQKLDAQFAHVWEFKDGKATRFQQYTDTGQFQKAAGS